MINRLSLYIHKLLSLESLKLFNLLELSFIVSDKLKSYFYLYHPNNQLIRNFCYFHIKKTENYHFDYY